MQPKRILIFSLAYMPFVGGAEVAIKELTDRIDTARYSFDLITLRFNNDLPQEERIGNVRVFRVGHGKRGATINDTFRFPFSLEKYLFPFFAYRKARLLHLQKPYDAVWSIMANYAGFAALFFKQRFPQVPFILTLQEGDPIPYIKKRVRFVYPWFQKIFMRATVVHAISTYLAQFAQTMGFRGTPIVVPNGVDISLFDVGLTDQERGELRTHLGLQINEHALVTTSRLVKKNGVSDVIVALTFLPKTTKFLVIGTGPDLALLKKVAKDAGVADRVVFVGHIPYEVIPYYLKISDVFVRPSLSEGMGNSFIEAMAAGVPVVGTPVGGIPDFLFDPSTKLGKVTPTGLMAAPENPQSVAFATRRFLEDETLREKIVENARQLAREKYDWSRLAHEMEKKVFAPLFHHTAS